MEWEDKIFLFLNPFDFWILMRIIPGLWNSFSGAADGFPDIGQGFLWPLERESHSL